MRQTFDHIADPAGTFEVYRQRHLVVADKGLVRSMSGYVERAALPSTRIERATGDVILIFEISAPIGLHTRAGLRHFHEGGFVAGLDTLPTPTEVGVSHAGLEVRLSPRAARRLLRRPLSEVARATIAVTELLDGDDRYLPERLHGATDWGVRLELLAEMLTRRLRVPVADERRVAKAFALLRRGHRVGEAAAAVNLSVTHLERLFADHFGVPPSIATRLDRLDRLVACFTQHPEMRWADLAQHLGYADQSHLAREVKAMTGLTATALRAALSQPLATSMSPAAEHYLDVESIQDGAPGLDAE